MKKQGVENEAKSPELRTPTHLSLNLFHRTVRPVLKHCPAVHLKWLDRKRFRNSLLVIIINFFQWLTSTLCGSPLVQTVAISDLQSMWMWTQKTRSATTNCWDRGQWRSQMQQRTAQGNYPEREQFIRLGPLLEKPLNTHFKNLLTILLILTHSGHQDKPERSEISHPFRGTLLHWFVWP